MIPSGRPGGIIVDLAARCHCCRACRRGVRPGAAPVPINIGNRWVAVEPKIGPETARAALGFVSRRAGSGVDIGPSIPRSRHGSPVRSAEGIDTDDDRRRRLFSTVCGCFGLSALIRRFAIRSLAHPHRGGRLRSSRALAERRTARLGQRVPRPRHEGSASSPETGPGRAQDHAWRIQSIITATETSCGGARRGPPGSDFRLCRLRPAASPRRGEPLVLRARHRNQGGEPGFRSCTRSPSPYRSYAPSSRVSRAMASPTSIR